MVDDLNQSDVGAVGTGITPAAGAVPVAATSNRMLMIVGAVVGLLAVAGIVAAAVFVFVLDGVDGDTQEPGPGVVTQTPVESVGEAPSEPDEVSLQRVFTFRDIFEPLIQPLPEEGETPPTTTTPDGEPIPGTPGEPGAPGTDPNDSGVALPEDTLFLRDVVSVDGAQAAVLYLNGQTYTLAEGAEIPGTPWRVLDISGRSVTMLYGDVQVTLSVGQGVVSTAK